MWTVTDHAPGCLPESDPVEFDDASDVLEYVADELDRFADDAAANDEHALAESLDKIRRKIATTYRNELAPCTIAYPNGTHSGRVFSIERGEKHA